jgi:hypothetical protein
MRLFRHLLVRRLVALGLLVGLSGWMGAPFATAHPQATAAQLARVHAAGPLEAALADALQAAARAPDALEAFDSSLRAALAVHPDGEALTAYLDEMGSARALLDLLVGQLLRGQSLPSPFMGAALGMVPTTVQSGPRATQIERSSSLVATEFGVQALPPEVPLVIVPLRVLSSAQPLGP